MWIFILIPVFTFIRLFKVEFNLFIECTDSKTNVLYSILHIIFAEFFNIHQNSIQRPELTNLDEDEPTLLSIRKFSLMMDVLDSDLNVGWAEVRNSAI